MNPLSYDLCNQTVTLYRNLGDRILRTVTQGFYRWEDVLTEKVGVERLVRKFLLILPGAKQGVFPGDRVFAGEGPEISLEAWDSFVPQVVPGLSQAAYAIPWYWDGVIVHTEAGRK